MADITNLRAFCEGMTPDEKEYLIRAEFIKMKNLIGALTPVALANLQAWLSTSKSIEGTHPTLRDGISGSATAAFQDSVLLDQFEKIQELRAQANKSLGPMEVTVLNLALKDPDNFTSITGPMSSIAHHLSNLGYGEIRNHIPGEQIQFRPNEKAKLKMKN